jgi:hypothetical protein
MKNTTKTNTIGRPTLYTSTLANRLAEHISTGLTDEEAAAIEGISADCLTRWRKSKPEFCGTLKKAEALRLKYRLARVEAGGQGWQGTAWALERIYPQRFSRPDIQLAQQINVASTDTLTEFLQRIRAGKEPPAETAP